MPKIYQFTKKDKTGTIKNVGKMEIKNQANNAELYFYGDIVGSTWDAWENEDMCPQDVQDFLKQLEGSENIDIYINSGGGDVFGGLAIYNMLKRNTATKTVHVDGLAASIASVIALAGDTVIIPKTAQFMIHNPWMGLWGAFTAKDFRQLADSLDACAKTILNVYQENLNKDIDIGTIQELMNNETWMTGEEAAQYFNIQVEETNQVAACANSDFFASYKHLPKNFGSNEPNLPNNMQNGNDEIMKMLKNIENRLNKLEKEPKNEPLEPKKDKKIEILKAKLALECAL